MNAIKELEKTNLNWSDVFRKFIDNKEPFRCRKCGRLLAYEKVLLGIVEIKCPRCKSDNKIYFDAINNLINVIRSAEK